MTTLPSETSSAVLRRSHLLYRVQARISRGLALSLTTRLILSVGAALAFSGLALLIALHPPVSLFYPLYWLYDNVYLFLQGYLWTLGFPGSLIPWGTAAVVLIVWLLSFLLDGAVIRSLHRQTVRAMVSSSALVTMALAFSAQFKVLGLRPGFFQAVVERDRLAALYRLKRVRSPSSLKRIARECIRLSEVLVRLLIFADTPGAFLDCLIIGHQTLVWCDLLCPSAIPSAQVRLLVKRLREVAQIVKKSAPETNPFSPTELATSLLDLLAYYEQQVWSLSVAQRVTLALKARQAVLDKLRNVLTDRAVFKLELSATALPALPDGSAADLNRLGQLALSLTLDTARQMDLPTLALGYLDSLDAVSLELAVYEFRPATSDPADSRRLYNFGHYRQPVTRTLALEFDTSNAMPRKLVKPDSLEGLLTAYVQLLDGLPTSDDYYICAALAQRHWLARRSQNESWRQLHRNQSVIGEQAGQLTESEIDLLRQAAQDEP